MVEKAIEKSKEVTMNENGLGVGSN